jgi:N-acetylmuramoyl-L-alanine amidase
MIRSVVLAGTAACVMLLAGCATVQPIPGGRIAGPAPASLGVREDLIPDGRYGRQLKYPLNPTYITIHSTGSPGGTAAAHGSLLRRGGIPAKTHWNRHRWNIWHFTVDDREVVQHMPLSEQGEHADHDGPGNRDSIGIEICEFPGDPARQRAAIDRAARLTAWLMRQYGIPLERVVPHYHWPLFRVGNFNKNCPRILLDGAKPGPRWESFLRQVDAAD